MAQAARKVTAKDPGEKLAQRRLTVLELAERLGNVSGGLPARRDRPDQLLRLEAAVPDAGPRGAEGPAADPQEPSADHAAGGGGADQGAGAGAPGLWLQPDRGDAGAGGPAGLGDHRPEDPQRQGARAPGTSAGWRWSGRTPSRRSSSRPSRRPSWRSSIPCFRERHVESAAPGELLSADTFFVGSLKGVGKVYLHAVVDTFGSYAFGFLHVSKQPEAAVAVLHNDVLPFYAQARPAGRRPS